MPESNEARAAEILGTAEDQLLGGQVAASAGTVASALGADSAAAELGARDRELLAQDPRG